MRRIQPPSSAGEPVPFADKLRQNDVTNSISSRSSRRQAVSDEAHSVMSGGTRSKRTRAVSIHTMNRQQQQQQQQQQTRPGKNRMRAALAAFGDCTFNKVNERKRLVSCGVAPRKQDLEEDEDGHQHNEKQGIFNMNTTFRLILIALIVFSVFGVGKSNGRKQAALLRGQQDSNIQQKDHNAVSSSSSWFNSANISLLSSLEKSLDLFSQLENDDDKSFDKKPASSGNAVETPYFWDVHFSGESIAEAVFSMCHGLTLAAEHGLKQSDYNEEKLQVFKLDGNKYVNVDTTTPDGIQRASNLGLASSHLADIIVSPYFHPMASDIFSMEYPGRMFALFRHPVNRALGMYFYLARASWDPMYNPSIAKMSIDEYSKSKYIENNWLTRFLVNKPRGKLTNSDLLLAKKIIKFKCLVGLYDEMEASLARFQKYFGWNAAEPEKSGIISKCRRNLISNGDKILQHPVSTRGQSDQTDAVVKEGSFAWNAIAKQNLFDMELYEYASRVFRSQGKEMFNIV